MREIKFRAYMAVGKKMVDIISIDVVNYIFTYKNDDPDRLNDMPLVECFGNAEIMQFTGLLDKNGKEIYEGDIITFDEYPFKHEGKQNYLATVEWIFAGWQYVPHCVNDKLRGISGGINEYLEESEGCEIIGNIHQNPELLK